MRMAFDDRIPLPYKGRGRGGLSLILQPPPNLPLHKGEEWQS